MKTIIRIILVIGTIHLSGCKDTFCEPHALALYFSFVTADGDDFFESDTRYDVNNVTLSSRLVYQLYTIDNKSVFETNTSSRESIVDFGNGDRDTLKVKWLPYDYGANECEAKDLEKVIFTYNDVVIDTWNFDPDLQFFYELVRRNNIGNGVGLNSNPIVILIPKTADEDELE